MTEESAIDVPQWKRDLISRRRSSGRAASVGPLQLTCPGAVIALRDPHNPGMRLPSAPPDIHQLLTQIESDQKLKMVEENSTKVHSRVSPKMNDENLSDSSEEFRYGPGIVSKLKSKYLSLTLRDNHGKVRPSLANMRRATSLENLLDEAPVIEEVKQPKYVKNAAVVNGAPLQSRRTASRNKDNMKRARSVEALMRCNRSNDVPTENRKSADEILRHVYDLEDETDAPKNRSSVPETEMPPPDLVKSTLKLFEPKGVHSSPPSTKSSPSPPKPAISPKPKTLDKLWVAKSNLKPINGHVSSEPKKRALTPEVDNAKMKINYVMPAEVEIIEKIEIKTLSQKSSPSQTTHQKRDETDTVVSTPPVKEAKITKSPFDRFIHQIENKRQVQSPEEPKSSPIPPADSPSPKPRSPPKVSVRRQFLENLESPPVKSLGYDDVHSQGKIPSSPLSPGSQMKQVGVIRPIVTTKTQLPVSQPIKPKHNDREVQKNLLNSVKSVEQPVTKVIVSLKKSAEDCTPPKDVEPSAPVTGTTWGPKPHSMVFNFSNRKDVPDYIENDGLVLNSKNDRYKPNDSGVILLSGSTADSSTDDVEELQGPPSPCQIVVIGGNVLINGKSSLQKSPKLTKLRIKFNDEATTFEYPSESSLLEDSLDVSRTASSPVGVPIRSGSLSSYTPSQLANATEFQLGITKTQPVAPPVTKPIELSDEEDYLRPADPANTVAWSAGTADDLLF